MQAPHPVHPMHVMAHFGEDLKFERERRGVSLETLSAETRVKLEHLLALEQERFTELPGGVFRRGIAQAYIAALGLDTSAWMERFTTCYTEHVRRHGASGDSSTAGWATFAENIKRNRPPPTAGSGIRWTGVLVLLALVALAAWATWHFLLHGRMPSV